MFLFKYNFLNSIQSIVSLLICVSKVAFIVDNIIDSLMSQQVITSNIISENPFMYGIDKYVV